MRSEPDYIREIEGLATNLSLTTTTHFLGIEITLPNVTIIKPSLKRVKRIYDECRIQGYWNAQRVAERTLERRPSPLKELAYHCLRG